MDENGQSGRFVKGDPRAGRKKGSLNRVTREVREMARALIEDNAYLAKLKKRLHSGKLAPPVETMLWFYAYGKPKETVEHTGADGGPLTLGGLKIEVLHSQNGNGNGHH